jgi:hypothetical protein
MIRSEPAVRTSIPKNHPAFLRPSLSTLAVPFGSTLSLGQDAGFPPNFPNRFPAQDDSFLFGELFSKMPIVKLGVLLAG